ncbi:hypothetical protein TESG_08494 [Trichophyton tonsurans CBS 112818]|uniref:Uncharacterized protein n=1 Tax=Trichophyton tonsurans (strain CBS 112818) TaxID=647933 RepID=F2S1L9_TRIT1|nr:hypothetical protein TESG_08494 [Trichophyton tonsurans CBS 112818]
MAPFQLTIYRNFISKELFPLGRCTSTCVPQEEAKKTVPLLQRSPLRPPEYQQLSHASCGQPPPSPYLQKLETREKLPFAGAAKSPARWQSFCCPLPSWLLKP